MALDGELGDEQRCSDLLVACALRNLLEYFELAARK